jgi:hypothetical protein
MNPVGQQHDHHPPFEIYPERRSGETKMTDTPIGEKLSAARIDL